MSRRRNALAGAAAVVLTSLGAAFPASAQAPERDVLFQSPERDFLFRSPRVSLGIRGGYAVARASSEIFRYTQDELTLERSDFDAPTFGGQLAIAVTPRLDVAVDLSVASTRTKSEFRDWVDNDDLPIEQETEFKRVPLTVGFKAYLKDRGRSVSRFAWVPARWAPYVGAAGGWVWYRFDQHGDFVDFETLDIFADHFTSRGVTPTVHVYGGADWSLGPYVYLTAEARYAWANADMSEDFVDFDPMDLSGLQGSLGISLRF
jgi:hypothetical protein